MGERLDLAVWMHYRTATALRQYSSNPAAAHTELLAADLEHGDSTVPLIGTVTERPSGVSFKEGADAADDSRSSRSGSRDWPLAAAAEDIDCSDVNGIHSCNPRARTICTAQQAAYDLAGPERDRSWVQGIAHRASTHLQNR